MSADFRTRLPRELYTAAQVRELDRLAIRGLGIEGFTLMQRAAAAVLDLTLDHYPQVKHLVVMAGPGNNGGDGYVVAALAQARDIRATVVQVGNHTALQGAAGQAARMAAGKNTPVEIFDSANLFPDSPHFGHTVIVDALLGIGLSRPVSAEFQSAIELMNASGLPVVAVDVPSGLCSDTGEILGAAVNAAHTVCLVGLKRGLLTGQGVNCCGELHFFDLETAETIRNSAEAPRPDCLRIDMPAMSRYLRARAPSAHKGDFGHTLVIGGDSGFGGAAIMAGEAALRSGSGLVSLVTRPAHVGAALARRPELMVLGRDEVDESVQRLAQRASVIVVGPGLGRSDWSRSFLQLALACQRSHNIPLVVDADGLNLLAEDDLRQVGRPRQHWILTPHPGEAGRLLGWETARVQADRFAAIRSLQSLWGGVVLLKGAGSLLCHGADGQPVMLCTEGNAGMASGGMGDVLSGVIGGLVAQGHALPEALQLAVCVHGESADLAVAETGQAGLLATDLLGRIGPLLNPGH